MSPQPPLVSIIIPTYNSAHFLAEALDSVVGQAYRPLEILVIDDGSTDSTAALVRDYAKNCEPSLYYHRQENQGPAAARNVGMMQANGDIFAFQDADDIWTPEKLTLQLALFEADPEIQVVLGCHRTIFWDAAEARFQERDGLSEPSVSFMLQAGLFRRSVFDQIGPLDESVRFGEDLDWYLRALERHVPIAMHEEIVVLYRRHGNNMTANQHTKINLTLVQMLRRSVARRRQSPDELAQELKLDIPDGAVGNRETS